MANIDILQLPVAINIDGSEYVPLVQAGTTKRVGMGLIVQASKTGSIQNANTFFAGPTSGSPATPSFRTPVNADLNSLSFNLTTTALYPTVDDGLTLGKTTNKFSDLFLAPSGTINWNSSALIAAQATDPFGAANSLVVTTATSAAGLTVTNTDPGAFGAILNLMHNSASPAVNDEVGALTFAGRNSLNAAKYYAYLSTVITNATAASEAGTLRFHTMSAGANAVSLQLTAATLAPGVNDGLTLGTSALSYSDLFLASGGVINWNNGTVTLTQSGNSLLISPAVGSMTTSTTVATANAAVVSLTSGVQTVELRINDGATTAICGTTTSYALSLKTNNVARVILSASGSDFSPTVNAGTALGTTALSWSNLFLTSGGVINWNNGAVTLTQSAGTLALIGGTAAFHVSVASAVNGAYANLSLNASSINDFGVQLYHYDGTSADAVITLGGKTATSANGAIYVTAANGFSPITNGSSALGQATLSWSSLFLASGGVINWNNGNVTLTHSAGLLTLSGALAVSGALATNGNLSVHGTNLTIDGAGVCSIEIGRTDGTLSSSFIDFHANATPQDYDVRLIASGGGAGTGLGQLQIAATGGFNPASNNNIALGTAALSFSDLFLGSGGFINWNNGNITATHSAGLMTFSGATSSFVSFTQSGDYNTGPRALSTAGALSGAGFTFDATATTGGKRYILLSTAGSSGAGQGKFALYNDSDARYEFVFTTNSDFSPGADNVQSLGKAGTAWKGLFLSSATAINWGNGAVTLTQSANSLAIAPASGAMTLSASVATANAAVLSLTSGVQTVELRINDGAASAIYGTTTNFALTLKTNNVSRITLAAGGTDLTPVTNASLALGTGSFSYNGLFLSTGTAINWANGNVTLTHSSGALTVAGGVFKPVTGTTALAPIQYTSGTNLTSAAAGACEFDGVQYYETIDTTSGRGAVPVEQYVHLTAAGSNISTIANFFGTTSNISLVASAYYLIDIELFYVVNTGTQTVTWTLTNSAAPTSQNIYYEMSPVTGMVAPPGTATMLVGQIYNNAQAAPTVVTAALSAANHYARFRIWLQNGTGTSLKIQATSSANTITPGINSYWRCRRISPNNIGTLAA